VAFVLHDRFDLNFEEIAPILDRTPEAARQLASRARRRVRGEDSTTPIQHPDRQRQREIVGAFLTAARGGDLQGLLAALDPNVVFRSDAAAKKLGGPAELRGAAAVAEIFKGRAQAARPALIDGALGIVVAPGGRQLLMLQLSFGASGITAIEAIADATSMAEADLEELPDHD
jgi:RNA polymerase sigma-70 factor (ECF subfamily)